MERIGLNGECHNNLSTPHTYTCVSAKAYCYSTRPAVLDSRGPAPAAALPYES